MDLLNVYKNSTIILLIFLVLGLLLPIVALSLGRMLRPSVRSEAKETTYESGIEPFHDSRVQFNVRYYMFALLFVIFDVETVFLYPWAAAYNQLGLFALVEMIIFIAMLAIGLLYAWKKKVLTWM
ncbi:NADH-quinone oxidoreductase subunit A [Falsibacillus pallidus]|uniref:NADH-quinone oxidoreductase subunit A n=1 Tax=Falsibacillus pallidus TaxID=493781 RepID=UPI003D973F84